MKDKIIPRQEKGKSSGAEDHRITATREAALALFREAKRRLQDINRWSEFSGPGSATFRLTDSTGKEIERAPATGDLVRIDLPGPGSSAGKGFDWVRIEAIEDHSDPEGEEESFAFRVRPVKAPESGENATAHFYTSDATSSFIVKRTGNKVSAAEEGRNEQLNTGPEKLLDKVRNVIVGTAARNGLAYPQWKNLMKGILKKR